MKLVPTFLYGPEFERTSGNNLIRDGKVNASQTLYIPVGETPTLNGGVEAVGALFYNITDSTVYKYDGAGVWTPIGGDFSAYELVFSDIEDFKAFEATLNRKASLIEGLYGGGEFIARPEEDSYTADDGIVFETGTEGIVWVRQLPDVSTISMEYYNVDTTGTINIIPEFNKAKEYLNTLGGGIITFPAGQFLSETRFEIGYDNITVKGAGRNSTFITCPADSGGGFVSNFETHYRYGAWDFNLETSYITYEEDNLGLAQKWIDLKIPSDISKLPAGTKIFINGGSNGYNVDYGEFNIVDHTDETGRVFLRYSLARDYTTDKSAWSATLTDTFNPPLEGSSATLSFSGTQPSDGTIISVGNDLYEVISGTSSTLTVESIPNKGNSMAPKSSGTKIFKGRAIILTPETTVGTTIQDLNISGRRRVIGVSNSIQTLIKNCVFNWKPDDPFTGGLWLDGDDGRDLTMEDCEVYCEYLFPSQMARSFTDIRFERVRFYQSPLQFTEFNSNIIVSNCDFHISYNGEGEEEDQAVIVNGNTVNNLIIINNRINASGIQNVFHTGELQNYQASGSTQHLFQGNQINVQDVGRIWGSGTFAHIKIINNNISGSVGLLYGLGAEVFGDDTTVSSSGKFGWGSSCLIQGNTFSGYVDGFTGANANVHLIGNITNRFGPSLSENEYDTWGNVMYTHFTVPTQAQDFVLSDNVFYNWKLLENSFSMGFPADARVQICNNKFFDIDPAASFPENDTIVDIKCPEGIGTTNITEINETINNILDGITRPIHEVVVGNGDADLNSSPNLTYNTSTGVFDFNQYSLSGSKFKGKGSFEWTYLTSAGENFITNNLVVGIYGGNINNGYVFRLPSTPNTAIHLIEFNQASMNIALKNGNGDVGGYIQRPLLNSGEFRIVGGKTVNGDNDPIDGWITLYTQSADLTLNKQVEVDDDGNFKLFNIPSDVTDYQLFYDPVTKLTSYGSAVGADGFVTLDTEQTITASKTWNETHWFTDFLGVGDAAPTQPFDVKLGESRMSFDGTRLALYDDLEDNNLLIGRSSGGDNLTTDNIGIGASALRNPTGAGSIAIGVGVMSSFGTSARNVAIGDRAFQLSNGSDNVCVGYYAGVSTFGDDNITIGANATAANAIDEADIDNTEIVIGTNTFEGPDTAAFILANSLNIGTRYPIFLTFNGTLPTPFTSNTTYANGAVTAADTIQFDISLFTSQGTGTTTFRLYNKQSNSIAIGSGTFTEDSNEIVIGNDDHTQLKINNLVVDISATPEDGDTLIFNSSTGRYEPSGGDFTAGGTGSQTINTTLGTANIASSGTSITITNSLVVSNSLVQAWGMTNDSNKTKVYAVVPTSGSFTVYVDPAPAATYKIGFKVTNH